MLPVRFVVGNSTAWTGLGTRITNVAHLLHAEFNRGVNSKR